MNTSDIEFDKVTELVRTHSKNYNTAMEDSGGSYLYAMEKDFATKYPDLQISMEENFIDKGLGKLAGKLADITYAMDSMIAKGSNSVLSKDKYKKRQEDLAKLKELLKNKNINSRTGIKFKVNSKYKAMGNTVEDFKKALQNEVILANKNTKLLTDIEKTLAGMLDLCIKIFDNPEYEESTYYDYMDKCNEIIEKAFRQCYEIENTNKNSILFNTKLNVSPVFGAVSKPNKEEHKYSVVYKEFGNDGTVTDLVLTGKEMREIAESIIKEPVYTNFKSLEDKIKKYEKEYHKIVVKYSYSTLYKFYKLGNFYRAIVHLGVFSTIAATKPLLILYEFESDVIAASVKALD